MIGNGWREGHTPLSEVQKILWPGLDMEKCSVYAPAKKWAVSMELSSSTIAFLHHCFIPGGEASFSTLLALAAVERTSFHWLSR